MQGEVGQKEPVQQQDPKSLSFRPEEAEVTAEEEVCCALLVLYDLFWWYMGLFECYIGRRKKRCACALYRSLLVLYRSL